MSDPAGHPISNIGNLTLLKCLKWVSVVHRWEPTVEKACGIGKER